MKERGKAAFKGNYWRCVLVAFILSLLTAGSSASGQANSAKNSENLPIDNEQAAAILAVIASIALIFVLVWIVLRIFVLNELEVGCHSFLKKNVLGQAANGHPVAWSEKPGSGPLKVTVSDPNGAVVYSGGDKNDAVVAMVETLTDLPVPGQLLGGVTLKKFRQYQKTLVMGRKAEGCSSDGLLTNSGNTLQGEFPGPSPIPDIPDPSSLL